MDMVRNNRPLPAKRRAPSHLSWHWSLPTWSSCTMGWWQLPLLPRAQRGMRRWMHIGGSCACSQFEFTALPRMSG